MALERNARELFRDVVARSPQLSDDLQTAALNIEDPVRLADFIAANLPSLPTLAAPGIAGDGRRAPAPGNPDPRTLQGTGSSGASQQDSGAGAGTSEPEPARVFVARAAQGDSQGTGRIRRRPGRNRRAARKARKIRNVRRGAQGVRPRIEAAREDDSGVRRVHGRAHLSRMDDFPALGEILGDSRKSTFRRGRPSWTKTTTTWKR